jgi:hypothetical protein
VEYDSGQASSVVVETSSQFQVAVVVVVASCLVFALVDLTS